MNTNTTKEFTTPLSREDMASYYIAVNEANKEIYKNLSNLIASSIKDQSAEMIKVITGLSETIQAMKNDHQKSMIDVNNKMMKLFAAAETNNEKFVNSITKSVAGLAEAQTSVSKEIRYAADMSRKQYYAIHGKKDNTPKKNPIFKSSLSSGEENAWIEMTKGDISRMFLENKYNKGDVYRFVYEEMKKNNYDIELLLEEYRKYFNRPNATQLEMIAASDAMRKCFTQQIARYGKNTNEHNINDWHYHGASKEVVNIISKLSKSGKPHGMAFSKAYKLLGIEPYKYRDEMIAKLNIDYPCSAASILSMDSKMVKKLETVVNKYLEDTCNG